MNSNLFDLTYLSTVKPDVQSPHEIGKISVFKKKLKINQVFLNNNNNLKLIFYSS